MNLLRCGTPFLSTAFACSCLVVCASSKADNIGISKSHLSAPVTVFTHGEGNFPCIRIPSLVTLPNNVVLVFASGRSYAGDYCYPKNWTFGKSSNFMVKRSSDGGATWGDYYEIQGGSPYQRSMEGASFYHSTSNTVVVMWGGPKNETTESSLWQAQSTDAGLTWTAPAPVQIPGLSKDDWGPGTHISPGSGIELRDGKHAGRLLHILIVKSKQEDVVIYSDDVGKTWQVSETRIPRNGEAQLTEVSVGGKSSILFSGRANETSRGFASSRDDGKTFADLGFCTEGVVANSKCQGPTLTDPSNSSVALLSHPAGGSTEKVQGNRTGGVLLRSNDMGASWQPLVFITDPNTLFGYSDLRVISDHEIGIAYETGDGDCTGNASACRIVFQKIDISSMARIEHSDGGLIV